jgi:hypothetical protein
LNHQGTKGTKKDKRLEDFLKQTDFLTFGFLGALGVLVVQSGF